MKFLPSFLLVACSAFIASSLRAQSVMTDPVGVVNLTIKGNSDTLLAVPLTLVPSYTGKVSATASGGTDLYNLTAAGTPGWSADQFAGFYYVRFTSGAKNGMYYTITANTSGQLTLHTAGDDLSGVAANDTFKVFKYWTLGTLFPPASAGTAANPLTASASSSPLARRSEILVVNPNAPGINASAAATYYFTAAGWYAAGSNQVANDVVLYPDNPFTVRQSASLTADVVWSSTGAVALSSLALPLLTQATGFQDNAIALVRPVDLKLSELGLDAVFTQSANTSPLARRDELLVFDNTVAGLNKSAAKVYYRTSNSWRRAGADAVVADADVLRAGDAFMIRKYQSGTGATVVWTNIPTY